MAVEKGAKTAVVWLLFTLPLSLLEGVFSQNGPQRSRARRCCAAKRTLHGEDRSEILDKREKGGPKWTAKMAQSLTASDTLETHQTICPSLGVHTNGLAMPYHLGVATFWQRASATSQTERGASGLGQHGRASKIGRASCRERVEITVVTV